MTAKSPDTSKLIADSLKKLMHTKSIEKIKIKDITDEAGIMRPTFYNHFQDKYEVVEYIFHQEVIEPMIPFLKQGLAKEAALFLFTSIEKNYDFYSREINREGQNSFKDIFKKGIIDLMLPLFNDMFDQPIHGIITPEHLAEFYACIFEFILTKWLNSKEAIPASKLIEVYEFLISSPLEHLMEINSTQDFNNKEDKMSD